MAPFQNYANFAATTLSAAISSGSATSCSVASGTGSLFAAGNMQAVIWPAGQQPSQANAEIITITSVSSDTLTIVRAQEGTTGLTFSSGANIAANITLKALTDLQSASQGSVVSTAVTTNSTTAGVSTGLAFNVAANASYQFSVVLMMSGATTTVAAGSKFAVSAPTGATGGIVVTGLTAAATNVTTGGPVMNATSVLTSGSFVGSNYAHTTTAIPIVIEGTVKSAATSGTATVYIAGGTATTVTCGVGSTLTAFRTS